MARGEARISIFLGDPALGSARGGAIIL